MHTSLWNNIPPHYVKTVFSGRFIKATGVLGFAVSAEATIVFTKEQYDPRAVDHFLAGWSSMYGKRTP